MAGRNSWREHTMETSKSLRPDALPFVPQVRTVGVASACETLTGMALNNPLSAQNDAIFSRMLIKYFAEQRGFEIVSCSPGRAN
jgi:hypothetical protein